MFYLPILRFWTRFLVYEVDFSRTYSAAYNTCRMLPLKNEGKAKGLEDQQMTWFSMRHFKKIPESPHSFWIVSSDRNVY